MSGCRYAVGEDWFNVKDLKSILHIIFRYRSSHRRGKRETCKDQKENEEKGELATHGKAERL